MHTACCCMQDLLGLGSIARVGYHVAILNNDRLQSLAGLSSLAAIGQDLYIRRNWELKSLEDMSRCARAPPGRPGRRAAEYHNTVES